LGEMKPWIFLFASLLALGLMAMQESGKPSPFSEKSKRPPTVPIADDDGKPARAPAKSVRPAKKRERGGANSNKQEAAPPPAVETGIACYFSNAPKQSGEEATSSEEPVAAHATYPLGSRAKVTNLANGKSVEVKIIGRFEASGGRIINVNSSAARQLDFVKAGTTRVKVELIKQSEPPARH